MTNAEWARRAWTHLVKYASKGDDITYSELAKAIGYGHHRMSRQLDPIYHFCLLHKLPVLSVLVVEKATGRPSVGAFHWDAGELEHERQRVISKDWKKVKTPSVDALAAAIPEQ
jgi:hypothetical protein